MYKPKNPSRHSRTQQRENAKLWRMLGEGARDLRQYHGMTQGDVADAIGISRSAYTNLELGKHGLILYHLYAIANVLEVDVSDLLPAMGDVTARWA